MPSKEQARGRDKTTVNRRTSRSHVQDFEPPAQQTHPAVILQRARLAPVSLTPGDALHMQRPCGNRAVIQMLAMGKQGAVPRRSGMPIQAKLTVGPVADVYERAADQAADQVVRRINAPASLQPATGQLAQRQEEEDAEAVQTMPLLQRQAEEDEELQMQPADGVQRQEEEELQATPAPGIQRLSGGGGMAATPELESAVQQARGRGQALSDDVRGPMEQAFGADFGGVRVHADQGANALSRSLQATAFTTGQDIFFQRGEYSPGSSRGQRLIAHELAHTMQQGASTRISRWGGVKSGVTLHKDVTDDAFTKLEGPAKQFYELPGVQDQVGRFSEDMDAREATKFQLFTPRGLREIIETFAEWKPFRSWKPGKKLKKVRSPKGWGKFKPLAGLRPLGQTGYKYKRTILGARSHFGKWLLTKKQRAKARERWLKIEAYANAKDVTEQENHAEGGMYEWPLGRSGAVGKHKARIENWYRFAEDYAKKRDWAHAFMFLGLALHTAEDQGAHGHGVPGLGHDPRRQIPIPKKWGWPETTIYEQDYRKGWQFHWCDTRDQNPTGYDISVRVAAAMLRRFAQFNAAQPPTKDELRQWEKEGLEPTLEWKYFYYPEKIGNAMKMVYTGSKKGKRAARREGDRRWQARQKVEKFREEREEKEAYERDMDLLLNPQGK